MNFIENFVMIHQCFKAPAFPDDIFQYLNNAMLLDPIYGYFDTHIAFLKGSGSGRTFVRFVPNLKVQVQVQVWTKPQIGGSLVH